MAILITANDDNDDSQLIMYFSPTSNFSTLRLQQILHVKPLRSFGEEKLWILSPKKTWLKHKKARDLMPCICIITILCLTKLVGVFDLAKIKLPRTSQCGRTGCGSAVYIRVQAPRHTNLEAETPN